MKQIKKILPLASILFFALVFFTGCNQNPIPKQGSKVSTSSDEFRSLARSMNLDCKRIDCCTLDGIETSCSFVHACLEAGLCQVVTQE